MKNKKYKTREKTSVEIDIIIDSLKKVFTIVNKHDEESAHLLMDSIKKLKELITLKKDISISPNSKDFANKYRGLCEKIGSTLDENNLYFTLMITDPEGDNCITYAHMGEEQMTKAISGAMMESPQIASDVLKHIGMPDIIVDPFIELSQEVKRKRHKRK